MSWFIMAYAGSFPAVALEIQADTRREAEETAKLMLDKFGKRATSLVTVCMGRAGQGKR
ncbi:MAG: hypothetical protein KH138_03590 [Firmicutes bacterium]|nr:hypothetical protein [Bacillota bacterium]